LESISKLSDKVVLITGASRGVGRETAILFGGQGARVVVNFKSNQDSAEEVAHQVREAGGQALTVRADVAEPEQVADMFAGIKEQWGGVDVLIANAAASAFKPLSEIKPHHIDRTLHITFHGFIYLVQHALTMMPPGGRIVAVSGWDSFRVLPGHGLLGAAKAAMEAMVKYLAVELGPRQIGITSICPGPIVTDSFRIFAGPNWDLYEKQWKAYSPTGRFATPLDIANIILFLSSPDSGWITGQNIVADGGISLPGFPLNVLLDGTPAGRAIRED
jgi:enoyl-[acyl-carrier protein] reductase III